MQVSKILVRECSPFVSFKVESLFINKDDIPIVNNNVITLELVNLTPFVIFLISKNYYFRKMNHFCLKISNFESKHEIYI